MQNKSTGSVTGLLAASALLAISSAQASGLLITEIHSNQNLSGPSYQDWFEVTNFGASTADLSGWTFIDEKADPAIGFTFAEVFIAPGESVVFTETLSAEQFRAWWGVDESVQIITYSGSGLGLGRGDAVNLFNAADELVLSLSYAPEGFTKSDGTPATSNLLNESNPAQLGHAGQAAGALETWISLVWDPRFGIDEPRYTFAVAGQWGAFQAAQGLDVGSPGAVVPLPAAVWLFLSGIGMLVTLRRRAQLQAA